MGNETSAEAAPSAAPAPARRVRRSATLAFGAGPLGLALECVGGRATVRSVKASCAHAASIRPGDWLVAIGGAAVGEAPLDGAAFLAVTRALARAPRPVRLAFARGARPREAVLDFGSGPLRLALEAADGRAVIKAVRPDCAHAGVLRTGDALVAIGGVALPHPVDLTAVQEQLRDEPRPAALTFSRGAPAPARNEPAAPSPPRPAAARGPPEAARPRRARPEPAAAPPPATPPPPPPCEADAVAALTAAAERRYTRPPSEERRPSIKERLERAERAYAPPGPNPPEAAAEEANGGWELHTDAASSQRYWHHRRTGESRWLDDAAPPPASAPDAEPRRRSNSGARLADTGFMSEPREYDDSAPVSVKRLAACAAKRNAPPPAPETPAAPAARPAPAPAAAAPPFKTRAASAETPPARATQVLAVEGETSATRPRRAASAAARASEGAVADARARRSESAAARPEAAAASASPRARRRAASVDAPTAPAPAPLAAETAPAPAQRRPWLEIDPSTLRTKRDTLGSRAEAAAPQAKAAETAETPSHASPAEKAPAPALTPEESRALTARVLETVREEYGDAVLAEFSARARAYARGGASAEAYVAYMRGVFGPERSRKMCRHLVRLLPDAALAAALVTALREAREAFG